MSATAVQPAAIASSTPAWLQRRLGRRARLLAGAFSLLLLAATAEIVLDAAAGHSPLVPKSPTFTHWMSFVGEALGFRVFLIALLVFVGAYAGLLALSRVVSSRWAVVLVAALHVIVLAGPILISTDVFSYIAYARMGVLHGVNPYVHGPIWIETDPIFPFVGPDWTKAATAYGPLYTLISYPLAWLTVPGAIWGAKLQALFASAGTLALTWRCARLRGVDQRFALLLVGANPLYIIYCLGGLHNDLIMIFFMMLGVTLALEADGHRGARSPNASSTGASAGAVPGTPAGDGGARGGPSAAQASGRRREVLGSVALVAAGLAKATGIAPLPFLVLSRRRAAPIFAALGTAVAGLFVAYLAFGVHGANILSPLTRDSAYVSTDGFPTQFAHLLGKPGVYPVDHTFLKAALVVVVAYLLWRTWRGYDWVAASGWSLLAISVTNAWLLPWYLLWCLPFAVVAVRQDRRLLVAALAVQALYVLHQISPILAPVS